MVRLPLWDRLELVSVGVIHAMTMCRVDVTVLPLLVTAKITPYNPPSVNLVPTKKCRDQGIQRKWLRDRTSDDDRPQHSVHR